MAHVSPPQANPGDELTASLINDPVNAIADEFNGGIDNTNIAPDGVTRDNVEDASQVAMVGSYLPQGFGANYKISRSVSSNNLIVSIKTKAGADPSASDPAYFDIGGTVRSVTSALFVTINAGTNTFNAGSAEHAGQDMDFFVYIGWNTSAGAVVLGVCRYPALGLYSDFSTTPTNEKYCAISNITGIASTDRFENVGRTNATLGASASYNWSLPATEVTINRPIERTRRLTYVPQYTNLTIGNGTSSGGYVIDGRFVEIQTRTLFGSTSSMGMTPIVSSPISISQITSLDNFMYGHGRYYDSGVGNYIGGVQTDGSGKMLPFVLVTNATYAVLNAVSTTAPFGTSWGTNDEMLTSVRAPIALT